MNSAPVRAGVFAVGTIVLGLGVVVLGALGLGGVSLPTIALLGAAVVLMELIQVPDTGTGIDGAHGHGCSFSSSVQMAAAIVLGPLPAALVACIGVIVVDPLRGSPLRKVAFNASVF